MSGKFNQDEYVDVAERKREFYARYPDGRLVCGSPPKVEEIGGKPYIWYHARAYRTPDDPFPGDGWAAEPVPGATPFTRDSELMNAETAAWGRAIVAVGIDTKKISSAEEIRNREDNGSAVLPTGEAIQPQDPASPAESTERAGTTISEKQQKLLYALSSKHQVPDDEMRNILREVSGDPLVKSTTLPARHMDEVIKSIESWVPPVLTGADGEA